MAVIMPVQIMVDKGVQHIYSVRTLNTEDQMKYTLQYDYREGMDCFVAIPEDENEDAFTLPGNTAAEALDYAQRTGLDVVLR